MIGNGAVVNKLLLLFFLFGSIGIAVEVFFVAVMGIFSGRTVDGKPRSALAGKSYVWMFPIYGSIALVAPVILQALGELHVVLRCLIVGAGILVVEFVLGWGLEKGLGRCPWKYEHGLHIKGFVRLDYFPFWVCFAGGIEWIYRLLDARIGG